MKDAKTQVINIADELETVISGAYIDENGNVISEDEFLELTDSEQEEYDPYCVADWLDSALDIDYSVNLSSGCMTGAYVCVAFGGPSIYVDTRAGVVRLLWWGEREECDISREACDAIDSEIAEIAGLDY